jgi:hypothetical protein
MDPVGKIFLWVYGLAAVIFIVLIVYLVIRRVRIKKNESFEKRDN